MGSKLTAENGKRGTDLNRRDAKDAEEEKCEAISALFASLRFKIMTNEHGWRFEVE
jgi:hypothetical protein